MIGVLKRRIDRFRGTGEASVTIPSMDGAFLPNNLLDEATVVADVESADNLVVCGDSVLTSSGTRVLKIRPEGPTTVQIIREFEAPISAMAASVSGSLGVALQNGTVRLVGGPDEGKLLSNINGRDLVCPTALAFSGPRTLLIALGSQSNPPQEWRRDLMERNTSGSVWQVDLENGQGQCLADNLAFPFGLMSLKPGIAVASEAWRHRLIQIEGQAKPRTILGDLPGYPARMATRPRGYWLTIFAPRRQMVEFVLREPAYRKRMLAEVPEPFWMAPALSSGHSNLEPLQGGSVKRLGIDKPWAPTRSYGLLIGLDSDFKAVISAHSRAGGRRHGVTSALSIEDDVLVTSRGGNKVLLLQSAVFEE